MILRQFLHFDPIAVSYLIGCGGKASAAPVPSPGAARVPAVNSGFGATP